MTAKTLYKIQSILSIILGTFLIINSQTPILGAVIGKPDISNLAYMGFGIFFFIAGAALFMTQKRK